MARSAVERRTYQARWVKEDRKRHPEKYREQDRLKRGRRDKVTVAERQKDYRRLNADRIKKTKADYRARKGVEQALYARAYNLKLCYGISLDEYNRLLEKQNGRCAICGELPPEQRVRRKGKLVKLNLFVDHDHATKKVRGLLCSTCNSGLGLFKDKPELLLRALSYLRKNTHASD